MSACETAAEPVEVMAWQGPAQRVPRPMGRASFGVKVRAMCNGHGHAGCSTRSLWFDCLCWRRDMGERTTQVRAAGAARGLGAADAHVVLLRGSS